MKKGATTTLDCPERDCSRLAESIEMWAYLGFEPWEHLGSSAVSMKGVARKITMVKNSVLGVIAKYYAWDYVVWSWQNAADPAGYLLREWKPLPDVVTQRFLLVGAPSPKRKARSFWMGLMGFLEVYAYLPGKDYHRKIKDLIPPVEMALGAPKG
ncbi:MAG: hypothetical protein LBD04_02325 [Synergistaceae bacterium]|jgi:hypothetical protein|nr:hypothetical protein [Synergistaceae bacterium]